MLPSLIMKLSSFICEENHVFIEEGKLPDKVITTEEELDATDVDCIGILVGFHRLRLVWKNFKNEEILR